MKDVKQFYQKTKVKIKKKLETYPAYFKVLRVRDKIAEHIRNGLLAFFNAVGPLWTFLFVKAPKPDRTSGARNYSL